MRGQLRALRLAAGDWVVMASDGLFADGPEWAAQQLELCAASGDSPQAVAELLVKTARMRAANHGRPDDITAAVLRLENTAEPAIKQKSRGSDASAGFLLLHQLKSKAKTQALPAQPNSSIFSLHLSSMAFAPREQPQGSKPLP